MHCDFCFPSSIFPRLPASWVGAPAEAKAEAEAEAHRDQLRGIAAQAGSEVPPAEAEASMEAAYTTKHESVIINGSGLYQQACICS